MSDFQVIGSGPNPFAPQQRTLTSAEILRALSFDPSDSMDHGRLRAMRHRLDSRRGLGGATVEQQLLEWSLTFEPKDPEVRHHDNPARIRDRRPTLRTLTLGDVEFVRSFEDADPKSVSAEDVKLLAELEASAQTESERRVVARVFGPIRRYHDRKEEEAELLTEIARHTPSGFRCAKVREAWQPVLAERLAEEARAETEPQLAGLPADVREKTLRSVEADAQQEAVAKIRDLWATLDSEAHGRVKAARERLSALATGAEPASSVVRTPEDSSLQEGRRRGREAREARDARADAFANFRTVG
jgi:hypothetical protein